MSIQPETFTIPDSIPDNFNALPSVAQVVPVAPESRSQDMYGDFMQLHQAIMQGALLPKAPTTVVELHQYEQMVVMRDTNQPGEHGTTYELCLPTAPLGSKDTEQCYIGTIELDAEEGTNAAGITLERHTVRSFWLSPYFLGQIQPEEVRSIPSDSHPNGYEEISKVTFPKRDLTDQDADQLQSVYLAISDLFEDYAGRS